MSRNCTDPGRSVSMFRSELTDPSRPSFVSPDPETEFGTLPAGLAMRFHPGRASIPLTTVPGSLRARQLGEPFPISAAPFSGINTRVDGIPTHDQRAATHPTKS